jgi:hypothetical protein
VRTTVSRTMRRAVSRTVRRTLRMIVGQHHSEVKDSKEEDRE